MKTILEGFSLKDFYNAYGIPEEQIGETSDGYHTFNALYRQRLVLTAALFNTFSDLCWKSRKHEDGKLCFGGGWFIVGIDTPEGQYAYHYQEEYWAMFKCEELETGKHWDGHTDKDVERLLSLNRSTKKMVNGADFDAWPIIRNPHIGVDMPWFKENPNINKSVSLELLDINKHYPRLDMSQYLLSSAGAGKHPIMDSLPVNEFMMKKHKKYDDEIMTSLYGNWIMDKCIEISKKEDERLLNKLYPPEKRIKIDGPNTLPKKR
jgi:hypothetical protein